MTRATSNGEHVSIDTVVAAIEAWPEGPNRVLVGIAGPPGAGKSTLAAKLAARLGPHAAVLPMDGYHLDNDTLAKMGLLERKGAPQTFDSKAFVHLVRALRQQDDVAYPTFDRDQDKTVPDGGRIDGATRIVLVEGNYLLLEQAPWSELASLWDLTVYLDVSEEELAARLVARWRAQGLSQAQAEARAHANDMKNGALVRSCASRADFVIKQEV